METLTTIGICGLGLIGGSAAKAYKQNAPNVRVLGYDKNPTSQSYALLCGMIDGTLDDSTLPECDLVLVALYPDATVDYMQHIAPLLRSDCILMDLCGVKTQVCEVGFALAKQYGFCFVGGHPMAGTHNSGIKYARATLFSGAPMVIVPPTYDNIALLGHIKDVLAPMGFGSITVSTAEQHDTVIAFTSQLAHVVSNAYVKSPTARTHKGFSAGSYKDMTRVAWLNEYMWSELFLQNSEPLLQEIDALITSLAQYRDAIAAGDKDTLRNLLADGRIAKEQIDGRKS